MKLSGSGINAALDAANYTITVQKVISGTGGLNILGNGSTKTVTFSAANTYAGDTKILCKAYGGTGLPAEPPSS